MSSTPIYDRLCDERLAFPHTDRDEVLGSPKPLPEARPEPGPHPKARRA